MAKSMINIHSGQVHHGCLEPFNRDHIGEKDMFIVDEDNLVVVGYTPSMIKLTVCEVSGAGIGRFHYYDWEKEYMFNPEGEMVAAFVEVTENGFVIDGEALVSLESDAAMIIWETYGCENDGSYRANMFPDPVAGDTPQDFIQPVVDEEAPGQGEYN